MTLDANKAAHIQAVVQRAFQGRQKTVVLVYQTGSAYNYTPAQVIFRPRGSIDPRIPGLTGTPPRQEFDMLMIAPITTSMTGVAFVADTNTPTAIAVTAAPKYEVIEALPAGIIPGGTHLVVRLRRFR